MPSIGLLTELVQGPVVAPSLFSPGYLEYPVLIAAGERVVYVPVMTRLIDVIS